MASGSTHAKTDAVPASFMDRHHFLLRRLHSLSGIVPVGIFVIFHLFTNFQMWPAAIGREGSFQHEVSFIHNMPALIFIELALWGGIGFHAGLGLVYTFSGRSNVRHYPYMDNWRYSLQRITGILALIFIFLHVATLRWRWNIFGWYTPFYVEAIIDGETIPLAHASTALALQASWLIILLYLIGSLSVVYHWANGLWTSAITWGLTISVAAQRRWGYACLGLGIVLAVFSIGAIVGALTYELQDREHAAFQYAIDNPDSAHAGRIEGALHRLEQDDPTDTHPQR